jgi:hypothetical protein
LASPLNFGRIRALQDRQYRCGASVQSSNNKVRNVAPLWVSHRAQCAEYGFGSSQWRVNVVNDGMRRRLRCQRGTVVACEKMTKRSALELAANNHITCRVNSVNLKNRLRDIETDCPDRLHIWLLRIVGASTAPTSMALPCRWRSRSQHQKRSLAASLRATATDIALTRRCSKNRRHDFLESAPDFGRRAFLYHNGAGHARADQDAGWHVRDVDPDRNALCQPHPGECGIDGREEFWTILVVLVRDAH